MTQQREERNQRAECWEGYEGMGSGSQWRADLGQEQAWHTIVTRRKERTWHGGRYRVDVKVGTGGYSLFIFFVK